MEFMFSRYREEIVVITILRWQWEEHCDRCFQFVLNNLHNSNRFLFFDHRRHESHPRFWNPCLHRCADCILGSYLGCSNLVGFFRSPAISKRQRTSRLSKTGILGVSEQQKDCCRFPPDLWWNLLDEQRYPIHPHLLEMYHKDHPTYEAIHPAEKELSGIVPMFINIEHPQSNTMEIEHLQRIQKLTESSMNKNCSWSYGPDNLIEKAHFVDGRFWSPFFSRDFRQQLFLFEMASQNLDELVSPDQKHTDSTSLCRCWRK